MDPVQPDDQSLAEMHNAEGTIGAVRHRAAGCDVSRLADVTDKAHSGQALLQDPMLQEAMPQDAMPQEAIPQEAKPGMGFAVCLLTCTSVWQRASHHYKLNDCRKNG